MSKAKFPTNIAIVVKGSPEVCVEAEELVQRYLFTCGCYRRTVDTGKHITPRNTDYPNAGSFVIYVNDDRRLTYGGCAFLQQHRSKWDTITIDLRGID